MPTYSVPVGTSRSAYFDFLFERPVLLVQLLILVDQLLLVPLGAAQLELQAVHLILELV